MLNPSSGLLENAYGCSQSNTWSYYANATGNQMCDTISCTNGQNIVNHSANSIESFQPDEIFQLDQPLRSNPQQGSSINPPPTTLLDLGSGAIYKKCNQITPDYFMGGNGNIFNDNLMGHSGTCSSIPPYENKTSIQSHIYSTKSSGSAINPVHTTSQYSLDISKSIKKEVGSKSYECSFAQRTRYDCDNNQMNYKKTSKIIGSANIINNNNSPNEPFERTANLYGTTCDEVNYCFQNETSTYQHTNYVSANAFHSDVSNANLTYGYTEDCYRYSGNTYAKSSHHGGGTGLHAQQTNSELPIASYEFY